MKRELAFALESHTQLAASLGRTRSSKVRLEIGDLSPVSTPQDRSSKRCKGSAVKESESNGEIDGSILCSSHKEKVIVDANGSEKSNANGGCEVETVVKDAINGVVEVPRECKQSALSSGTEVELVKCAGSVASSDSGASDGGKNQAVSNAEMNGTTTTSVSLTPTKKLEMKMSKKIVLGKVPKTVKELFATGLLEGYPVFYNGATKGATFRGMIKDTRILCFCSLCKGSKVLSPRQFEFHACNSYRHAAQRICLENGSSLLEVVEACKQSHLDTIEETIQCVIGLLPEKESIFCLSCKGSFVATYAEKVEQLCKSCVSSIETNNRSVQPVLALRRSGRNASGNISSQDINQDKINEDRSSKTSLVSISPRSNSSHIFSQERSELKTTKGYMKLALSPKSSGSSSVRFLRERKSEGRVMQKSSKAVLSPQSKSSSVFISPQQKSKWKITRKDLRLHRLVFEDDGLPDGTEVAYYSRGQKLLEGYKRGLGIFCRCCNSEVSASTFEAHAGMARRRKPYNFIYTSNGVSLHEFAISLLKGRKCSVKDNDDLCIICADGGNLLLCDGCPRAFHIECASVSSIPRGKWFCQYCQNMFQREKYVESNDNAKAAGRVAGVDLIEQITKRCIRIVKNPEDAEVIACVLCRGYDFSKSGFGARTVIVCDQCEKEYHVGCLREHSMVDLKELPEGKWFCCMDCRSIFSDLQNLLNRGEEEIHDSLLDVIKQKHEDKVSDTVTHFDVKWRVLSGKIASPETRLLLSKAVAIFHECFNPIVDSATGKDFIPSMVYGRNIRGQDFAGMYCAVLLVNSSVVSAGIFRVFGQEIAELPLVATSNCNQGKGYFQLLFSCIEKLLACLNVKNLVLPAAPEAESIWTDKFGFQRISPEQLSNYRKICWQMLTFKGTCMLQKVVPSVVIPHHVINGQLTE